MRITGVSTAVVEANYDWTFVRIDAEGEGLSGIGECFCAPGLTGIVKELSPLLIGEDARDIDRLWSKLRWGCSGAGSSAGIVYNAISGIEAALWDLVGQHYGVPIYRLLGGKFRDSVRMYADCHAGEALHSMSALMIERPARWGQEPPEQMASGALRNPEHGRAYAKGLPDEVFTPELYAERAKQVVAELGFSALKFDLDVPTPYQQDTASGTLSRAEIKYMVSLAAAVIDAVGDEVDVAFDCHWRYQVSDACRLAHEVEDLGLMWLEDPVPPENVQALARVTKSTSTPIATGENGYMRHGFREAFENGAMDIAAPDPQKTGGLLETRRIADYADTHYISMAPHCIASPIGTIANVHVAAAIPNFLALEWHGMSVPFWNDLAVRVGRQGHSGRAHPGAGQARPGRDPQPRSGPRVRAAGGALLRRMIAATYSETGPSSVLEVREIDTPEPGPGEVRVKLEVAGVNPTDWKGRAGATGSLNFDFQIPGQDGAGVIDAVGEGVAKNWVGERVWVYLAGWQSRYGTAAQYTVVPIAKAVPLGDASFDLGASLGVPAVTAYHCLFSDGPIEGKRVLVAGGAGAVGHAAISLAKWGGAEVVTTVSSPEKAELASAADVIVNYRQDGAAEKIGKVDRIVELALGPNFELDMAVANEYATIITYASDQPSAEIQIRPLMMANLELRFMLLYTVPKADLEAAIAGVSKAVNAGALTTLPLHRFPLAETAAAHDAVEGGAVGKVVIDVA